MQRFDALQGNFMNNGYFQLRYYRQMVIYAGMKRVAPSTFRFLGWMT